VEESVEESVVVGVWELCECVGRMKKRGNGHDAGLTRCRDQMRARCCTLVS